MPIIDGHIRCSRCGENRPLSEYQPSIVKKGCGSCRTCKYIDKRAHEKRNPGQAAARTARQRRMRDPEEFRAERRMHYSKNRETYRNYNLGKYGITSADYDKILASQGGCCACCGVARNRSGKRLFVDHDHVTGVVRGLLCHACNAGIGHLGDTIDGVQRAIDYLRRAQQRLPVRSAPSIRINLLGAN